MNSFIKRAMVGGVVATAVLGAGTLIIGRLSGYKAADLLSTSLSGTNLLCNTVILGSSTILALMLTILSLSKAAHSKLNREHYHRVLTLAKVDTLLIITAVITFLLLNLPYTKSPQVPTYWYSIIYYVNLVMASILGGGFIAVVTMLYGTIRNVIMIVGYRMEDHPLVDKEDVEEAKHEQDEAEKDEEKEEKNKKEN